MTPCLKIFIAVFLLILASGESLAAQKNYSNSIGMEFILIPAGSFTMGADKDFEEADDDETPQHWVRISKPFYLGIYEVTQAQWTAVMENNPSKYKYDDRSNPVEQVSWDDAQAFIERLNAKEGHSRYRLPTEAEWEYAARAGSTSAYSFGNDSGQLGRYAWCGVDWDLGLTHPVGQKQPNAWGLYDMYGNVWEWVQDWYGENYYRSSPATDPAGPWSGWRRVVRGGNWSSLAWSCRSANRGSYPPGSRDDRLGFRLALDP
jgi:formylglycine-generating enzyme required for sulfatase activity